MDDMTVSLHNEFKRRWIWKEDIWKFNPEFNDREENHETRTAILRGKIWT